MLGTVAVAVHNVNHGPSAFTVGVDRTGVESNVQPVHVGPDVTVAVKVGVPAPLIRLSVSGIATDPPVGLVISIRYFTRLFQMALLITAPELMSLWVLDRVGPVEPPDQGVVSPVLTLVTTWDELSFAIE